MQSNIDSVINIHLHISRYWLHVHFRNLN